MKLGFYPDASNNEIIYGLKPIQGIGTKIAKGIIDKQPSTSVEDFYNKMQEFKSEASNLQEVVEPSNIAGTKIIREGNKLTLENSKLNLSSMIENYQYISSNNLDLSSFIEDYKKDSKAYYEENENEIKMYATGNVKCQKKLYIDKKTESPTQLEIGWTNKSNKVYILYNEVEIK